MNDSDSHDRDSGLRSPAIGTDDQPGDDTENGQEEDSLPSAKKPQNFRKRRLSLPRHHIDSSSSPSSEAAANDETTPKANAEVDDEKSAMSDEKAQTFRKRRLSLTLNRLPKEDDDGDDEEKDNANNLKVDTPNDASNKRRRLLTVEESQGLLGSEEASPARALLIRTPSSKARISHSMELLSGGRPPSPITHAVLHQQKPLPPSQTSILDLSAHEQEEAAQAAAAEAGDETSSPTLQSHSMEFSPRSNKKKRRHSWKQRHHHVEEEKLPFPKDVVGTYSCHGVEPIYDSDYDEAQPEPDDDEDEDDGGYWGEKSKDTKGASDKPSISAKINQDRGGVCSPYANSDKTALFAVYDGHGQGGELVSQFALHEIQQRLEKHPSFPTNLEKALRETFLAVDEALKDEPIIEPYFAGTTACVALLQDQKITLANAGDSRAVMARKRSDGQYDSVDLTVDQNPDSPDEMDRIIQLGGYVSPPPGEGLSARVWLDPEMTQIGLAMARSIGDHAVADVGVIADPVVTSYELREKDEFMILASDGVWEFLESSAAVQIVGDHLDELGATKACQALIEAAASRWHEEEGEYRDDITAIVVRVKDLWGATSS